MNNPVTAYCHGCDARARPLAALSALGRTAATTLILLTAYAEPAVSENASLVIAGSSPAPSETFRAPDPARSADWLQRWQKSILNEMKARYCDTQMGEEIGWLMAPVLSGFYYGYLATKDPQWVDRLVDWADSWIKRGVIEPDGFVGWPKVGAAGADVDGLDGYYADSMVGEAKALRPVVLMAALIRSDPMLEARYGAKADDYLKLARSIFAKWEQRGAWRPAGDGVITVVLPFGIDRQTGAWTDSYASRAGPGQGFSHPDNKANIVASWLLAMFDATGDAAYKDRAEAWFRLMKSRMKTSDQDTYAVWNYWEPAGIWDYRRAGVPKHWVGVHPNPGYYAMDVEAMVQAYEHGVIFTGSDILRLARTASAGSRFWPALAAHDSRTRRQLEESLHPGEWSGLELVPWYLSLRSDKAN